MPTEYRLNLFLKSRERFVAVSSCAETLIASGGIWKSLDADQETESLETAGTFAPSTDLSRHFQEESITPIAMSDRSCCALSEQDVTNIETSLVRLSQHIHEQTAQIMRGLGMVTELLDSVLSLPDLPWGTIKSY